MGPFNILEPMKVLEECFGVNPSTDVPRNGSSTGRAKPSFCVVVPLMLVSLFLLFCVTGCTSTKVLANSDRTAVHPISRLFVVVYSTGLNDTHLAEYLVQDFRVAFTNWPVAVEANEASVVELDQRALFEKAQDFQADALLVVQPAGGVVSPYGGYELIMYDASLFTSQARKRVWRARLESRCGFGTTKRQMRGVVEQIVGQLEKDGFLNKNGGPPAKPLRKEPLA